MCFLRRVLRDSQVSSIFRGGRRIWEDFRGEGGEGQDELAGKVQRCLGESGVDWAAEFRGDWGELSAVNELGVCGAGSLLAVWGRSVSVTYSVWQSGC